MCLLPRRQSAKGVGPGLSAATSQRLGATSQDWQPGSRLLYLAKWFGRTACSMACVGRVSARPEARQLARTARSAFLAPYRYGNVGAGGCVLVACGNITFAHGHVYYAYGGGLNYRWTAIARRGLMGRFSLGATNSRPEDQSAYGQACTFDGLGGGVQVGKRSSHRERLWGGLSVGVGAGWTVGGLRSHKWF